MPTGQPGIPHGGLAMADPPGIVVARKPSGETGILGAPVAPATPGAPPSPPATPGVLTGTANDLLAAAERVRKTEPRFAGLTVETRHDTLVVGGTAPQASDAWDFAKKLQTLPGVGRVAVGAVAGKR
jgi:hypothetical protein